MRPIQRRLTRRSFLSGAAARPAFGSWTLAEEAPPPSVLYRRAPRPITSADQVIDVMDFEPLARAALPPAHFAFIATGVDDDRTVVRNHEAFAHYEIRARRFAGLETYRHLAQRVRDHVGKPALRVMRVVRARLPPAR